MDREVASFRPGGGHRAAANNIQLLLCGDLNSLPDSGPSPAGLGTRLDWGQSLGGGAGGRHTQLGGAQVGPVLVDLTAASGARAPGGLGTRNQVI